MIGKDFIRDNEVSNLFNEVEKETEEDITKKNKQLEEDIRDLERPSIYKTNKALEEKGYKYNSNGLFCPFNTNPQYYLRIGRNPSKYEYSIGLLNSNNEFENKTSKIYDIKPITSFNERRERELKNQVKININPEYEEDPFPDGTLEKGLNRFSIELSNVPDFEQVTNHFKDYEEKKAKVHESKPEDIVETAVFSSFEEYPSKIKEIAIDIIEEDKLFDNIIKAVSILHKGNNNLKESLILVCGSVYIDEPVQTEISAGTGAGKTNIVLAVVDNYPVHHVKILRTVSSKNIYYDKDNYNTDFNILVHDDVLLNEGNIETIKELTDNKKRPKELKTVSKIDGTNKAVTYTLDGSFLNILTYAKTNPDEELSDRLFKGFVEEDTDKSEVKRFIKRNALIKMKDNKQLKLLNQINQCSIQYLVERKVSVYNPFILLLNPDEFNNRDIAFFISLANAKTFYHYSNRRKINIKDRTVLIGTLEDYKYILRRWDKDTQKYKLSERQKAILNNISEYDSKKEFYDFVEEKTIEYRNIDSKGAKTTFRNNLDTIPSLVERLGVNKDTLKQDIYQSTKGRNKKNLEELGLVEKLVLDENEYNSSYVFGRIKSDIEEEVSVSENNIDNMNNNEIYQYFNTLETKIKLLIYFLNGYNISISYRRKVFLDTFCSNYTEPITDYDSLCNFIESFILEFEDLPEEDELDIENIFRNFEYLEETEKNNSSSIGNGFLYPYQKTTENSSNAKQDKESLLKQENIININNETEKEEVSEGIDVLSYNYPMLYNMIIKFLKGKGTETKKNIVYHIAENYETDPYSEDFEHTTIQIETTLKQMVENKELKKDYNKYSIIEGAVKQ